MQPIRLLLNLIYTYMMLPKLFIKFKNSYPSTKANFKIYINFEYKTHSHSILLSIFDTVFQSHPSKSIHNLSSNFTHFSVRIKYFEIFLYGNINNIAQKLTKCSFSHGNDTIYCQIVSILNLRRSNQILGMGQTHILGCHFKCQTNYYFFARQLILT
jgi:hypothetical protein